MNIIYFVKIIKIITNKKINSLKENDISFDLKINCKITNIIHYIQKKILIRKQQ
jgi:hypothetical protein